MNSRTVLYIIFIDIIFMLLFMYIIFMLSIARSIHKYATMQSF